MSAGCYLVTQQAGSVTKSQPLILSPNLAEEGVWGVVKIKIFPSFWNPTTPPDFNVGFKAREETLDYYVVAPKTWAGAFDGLSISNATLSFNKIPQTDSSNDGISPELLGVPKNSRAMLFRSNSPVTRSAATSLSIQLARGEKTLVKNLPLPGAEMPSARFVVHLSKP